MQEESAALLSRKEITMFSIQALHRFESNSNIRCTYPLLWMLALMLFKQALGFHGFDVDD